jgi:hypothetical protein
VVVGSLINISFSSEYVCPGYETNRHPDHHPLIQIREPGVSESVWRGQPQTRVLQLALAGFWAIDALLQLQPANFSGQLVLSTILGNAENQPQPIFGSLVSAAHLLAPVHVELNIAIIVIQLALACGLLCRRTVKPALALSVAWALGVWWLGEGFGGIFAGKATLLVGAPGPALLYALLALIAWPAARRTTGSIAAAGALGERAALRAWALLWAGGAILRVVPFWVPPVYALAGDLQLGLDQEPHIEASIGIGVLTRYRRASLAAGVVLSTVYWTFGQQFAGLMTGSATDIAAGPPFVLLAVSLWPHTGDPGWAQIRIRRLAASPTLTP